MSELDLFFKLLLTIIIGAIVGLETETRTIEQKGPEKARMEAHEKLGGLRTYTVLSLFGGLAGIFYIQGIQALAYILFAAVIILTIAAYILNVQIKKAFGITTEIAIIIIFSLGFLITSSIIPLTLVLVMVVLLSFFLSQKRGIGNLINKVEHKEVIDLIKFGLVSVVILPFLPNSNITLGQIIGNIGSTIQLSEGLRNIVLVNAFEIWLLVVLISGINLLSYILSKFIGEKRGLLISGLLGGIFSSTSSFVSVATTIKNKKSNNYIIQTGAVLLSNSTSYISISLFMILTSRTLFREAFPVIISMVIASFILGLIFINLNNEKNAELEFKYEPFSIIPAIKFVALIVIIKFIIQLLSIQNVDDSILAVITALSGFTGMDTSTIALGELVKAGTVTLNFGLMAFVLANAINFLAKSIYSIIMGNLRYGLFVFISLLFVALIGLFGLAI